MLPVQVEVGVRLIYHLASPTRKMIELVWLAAPMLLDCRPSVNAWLVALAMAEEQVVKWRPQRTLLRGAGTTITTVHGGLAALAQRTL